MFGVRQRGCDSPAPAVAQVARSEKRGESGAKGLPAGKALAIIVIGLAFGLLFDSGGIVHAALGMRPGPARTAVLMLARPVDSLAQRVWLDRPKRGLDQILGHEPGVNDGLADGLADSDETAAGLVSGPADHADQTPGGRPGTHPVGTRREPGIVSPTATDPLRVLVVGDSLAPYLGGQLADLAAARGLIRVSREWHDATGIANSEYFDWRDAGVLAARTRRAQAVVIALGVQDCQDMSHRGRTLVAGSDEWRDEYARRVALIMQALVAAGVQRVYWQAPPRVADPEVEAIFARADEAIGLAAQAVPGARNLDPRQPGESGPVESELVDGRQQRTRAADGVRWTYAGARHPAEVALRALQSDYGDIG